MTKPIRGHGEITSSILRRDHSSIGVQSFALI
jgi:hypothetical protein